VETAFPNGLFPTGAIHEFISLCLEDTAACGGFISGLVKILLFQGARLHLDQLVKARLSAEAETFWP
jgi:hypothetical protein